MTTTRKVFRRPTAGAQLAKAAALVCLVSPLYAAESVPNDTALKAAYCSVVTNIRIGVVQRLSLKIRQDANAPADILRKVETETHKLLDQKAQLDSYLVPVLIAAQEQTNSAYAAALAQAADRANADAGSDLRPPSPAATRLARCSDLTWLP